MILDIIIIFILLLSIGFGVNYYEDRLKIKETSMSFKEAMDLVELPVVTFYCSNRKLNFLLDTGSNNSIINKSELKTLHYTELDTATSVSGMEGNYVQANICNFDLYYNENHFNYNLVVVDMDSAFNNIKKESGVQIHGILGSKFFEEYKYILDFNKLVAYIKK